MVQSWKDKQNNYFGSDRMFYSGVTLNSGAAWNFVNFSGTNTGFGPHGNTEANRFIIASSGNSVVQWSWDSGTSIHGELYGADSVTMDGVNRSGVWLRAAASTQKVQLWSW